jgi:hypothetical protein
MIKDIFFQQSQTDYWRDREALKRPAIIGGASGNVFSRTHPQKKFLTLESEVRTESVAATPFQSPQAAETCGATLTGGTEGVFATETGAVSLCRL